MVLCYHYTDLDGYNAARSQPVWRFKVATPPGGHPRGAYFTSLGPETKGLANRLGIPKAKTKYVFSFLETSGLRRLHGHRGRFIYYSASDYEVKEERQVFCGKTEEAKGVLR